MAEAELEFVARLTDQASAAAGTLRREMKAVGGPIDPITGQVTIDADRAARALDGIEADVARVDGADATVELKADASKLAGDLDGAVAKAKAAGEEAGSGFADGMAKAAQAGAAGGLLLGGAAGAAVLSGMGQELGADKLAAVLGLDAAGPRAQELGAVAGSLYANAYGGSLAEVNGAVAEVMTSIGGMRDASAADLETVTAGALDFAAAMEVDVATAARSAGILVKTGLAANAQEGFDLLTRAAQEAGPGMVEPIMEAANEYGVNFAAMGISGRAAMAVLVDASKGGEIALDKAGDAVKEFGIRATDLGDTGAQETLKALGLSGTTMANDLLAGGDRAATAFASITDGLLKIDDPAAQAAAAVSLFGTPLEDLGKDSVPAFLAAMQQAGGELENVEGATARMGATLADNASTNLTAFRRGVELAFVEFVGGKAIPVVKEIAGTLSTNLGPALSAAAGFLGDVAGAARDASVWLKEHDATARVLGTGVAAVLAVMTAAWVAQGAVATVNAAKAALAWLTTATASTTSATIQSRSTAQITVGWIAAGAAATVNAAKAAAAWALSAAGTVASNTVAGVSMAATWIAGAARAAAASALSAASTVAAWVAAGAATVASLVVTAAGFVAQGAVMAATMAATAARVVAGWVVMGAQSLLAAAKMAAAWLIALGPIGLAIAAVALAVALVIKYWDQIKAATVKAWEWISDKLSAAWQSIRNVVVGGATSVVMAMLGAWDKVKGAAGAAWDWIRDKVAQGIAAVLGHVARVSGVVDTIRDAFGRAKDAAASKVGELVSFVGSLPGKIVSAVSGIANDAAGIGRDVIDGIIRGVRNGVGMLTGAVRNAASAALNAAKSFLGINSPSRVFRDQIGAQLPAGMALGISAGSRDAVAAAAKMAASVTKASTITGDAGRFTNALSPSALSVTASAGSTVTIRHEVVSPDGSVSDLDARQIADMIARDPRSAERIEAALRTRRDRRASTTIGR